MATQNVTPEMGKNLRQIVDNNLEEGEFESGFAALDQARSPNHKPSIIHVLHLIFTALHSVTHGTRLDESGTDPIYDPTVLIHQSPRKMVKQSKSALFLSPETVTASQRLLLAFVSTNLPNDIDKALPHYPENEIRRQLSTEGEAAAHFGIDYMDSPIYNQCIAIRDARSVWEILKEGYTDRTLQTFGAHNSRGRGKQGSKTRSLGPEPSFSAGTEEACVGDNSWFLLEWLVTLFERDAEVAQEQGSQTYSQLLLRQLPPPPLNTSTRWDASEPLKIIAFSLQQSDVGRRRIGLRLLNLLIDLAQTPYLNLSSLASSTLAQITSSSTSSARTTPHDSPSNSPGTSSRNDPHTPNKTYNSVTTLFNHLSSKAGSVAFKITLCQKILQDVDDATANMPDLISRNNGRAVVNIRQPINSLEKPEQPQLKSSLKRPRPTPRFRPQETDGTTPSQGSTEPGETSTSRPTGSTQKPPRTASVSDVATDVTPVTPAPPPLYLPSFSDVSRLAKAQPKAPSPPVSVIQTRHQSANGVIPIPRPWSAPRLLLRVKFELLHACVASMKRLLEEEVKENPEIASRPDVLDWTQSLSDGLMHELLLVVFGPQVPASSGDEAADRIFYADVIKSIVGFPIDAD